MDYTVEDQTYTHRLRIIVKLLEKQLKKGNTPGSVKLLIAKNKIIEAIIEIENS